MRVRHLPILDNDQMVGIISIGDLVKDTISEYEFVILQLERYIYSTPEKYPCVSLLQLVRLSQIKEFASMRRAIR
jgi:hypothetical protein